MSENFTASSSTPHYLVDEEPMVLIQRQNANRACVDTYRYTEYEHSFSIRQGQMEKTTTLWPTCPYRSCCPHGVRREENPRAVRDVGYLWDVAGRVSRMSEPQFRNRSEAFSVSNNWVWEKFKLAYFDEWSNPKYQIEGDFSVYYERRRKDTIDWSSFGLLRFPGIRESLNPVYFL